MLGVVPTLGQRISELREAADLSVADLAGRIGVGYQSVWDWENDRRKTVELDTLFKLAKGLNTTIDTLLEGVDEGYETVKRVLLKKPLALVEGAAEAEVLDIDVTTGYKRNDIPVIAEGDASPQSNLFWDEAGLRSDVEDRISRPFDVRDPLAYGVKVRGDSMMPRYRPGETLVVSPNTDVEDGDEVYVALLSGERLLKVARRSPGGWILESENRAYPARFVKKNEIGTMHPILWIRPARRARGDR